MEYKFPGIAYKGSGSSPIKSVIPSSRRIRREEERAKEREQRKLAKILGGSGK